MAKRRRGKRKHTVKSHRRKGSRVRRHLSREEAPRRKRRHGRKRRRAHAVEAPRRRRRRKHGRRRRARASEAPRRKRRRGGRRKHRVRGHMSYEAPRRRGRRRHRRGALENPLGGMELAIGALTGIVGYTAADVLDRFIATRADAPLMKVPEAAGVRTDVPIYMDWFRLGAGVGIAAAPLIGAQFIKGPALRAALQFFGFGAAFNVLGKAVTGFAAYLLKDNDTGKRLYATDIAAAELEKAATGTAGLAGLTESTNAWLAGLGSCCRGGPSLEQHKLQPPGGGVPPNVRVQQPQAPPPPYIPPPPAFVPPPPVVTRRPNGGEVPGEVPGTPGTTVTTPGPATPTSMLPPVAAFLPTSMLAGLGRLSPSARQQFQPAIDAISAHRDAFAAVQNRTATPEQTQRAQAVVTAFGPQIRAMHGLAALGENNEPSQRRPSPFRWGEHKNNAA